MRKIRDVLRLDAGGLSRRQIAASLSVSKTTIRNCLRRAEAAGICWPLADDLTDAELSEEGILAGHFGSTRSRFVATSGPVLVLQDTTEFTYQRERPERIGVMHSHNCGRDGVWLQPSGGRHRSAGGPAVETRRAKFSPTLPRRACRAPPLTGPGRQEHRLPDPNYNS